MNNQLKEIPKIIHQTWKTNDIPEHWLKSYNGYKNLEKEGWEYKLWTDDDNRKLIEKEFPWFLEKYDSYKYGIQRADAIRYFILYKYGGVYSDLDIAPKSNFVHFFEIYKFFDVAICSCKEGNSAAGQNLTNAFMMSKPGSDFWPHVWTYLQQPFQTRKWKRILASSYYFYVLFTTGPGIICDAVSTYKKKEEIVLIPSQLIQPFDPKNKESKEPITNNSAVTEVLPGSSWHKKDSRFWKFMGSVGNNIVWVLLSFLILFLFLTILFLYLFIRTNKKLKSLLASKDKS
jgi:inositol phosphorylceramide mannosyltransferase catalytic subunit